MTLANILISHHNDDTKNINERNAEVSFDLLNCKWPL